MSEDLKIIELRAENFMALKAIELELRGESLVITGRNAQGKSSLLESIMYALTGKKLVKPIREGQEKAVVELKLGDGKTIKYIVKQVITVKGERLEVTTADGDAKYASPRKFLDQLMGSISFDPLDFANLSKRGKSGEREQRQLLLDLVQLDVSQFDEKYDNIKAARAQVKSNIEFYEGNLERARKDVLDNLDAIHDVLINETDIIGKIREFDEKEQAQQTIKSEIESNEDSIRINKQHIETSTETIQRWKNQIKIIEDNINAEENEIGKLVDLIRKIDKNRAALVEELSPVSPSVKHDFEVELSKVKDENEKIRIKQSCKETIKLIEDARALYSKHLEQMKTVESDKAKAMGAVKFPIPGLSVDENSVLYNGIPLAQCSCSERTKISTAIAMAMNPKLHTIIVKDGNELDSKSLKEIIKLTGDKGYQLLIEKCDESGKVGIVIEDGGIIKDNRKEKKDGKEKGQGEPGPKPAGGSNEPGTAGKSEGHASGDATG